MITREDFYKLVLTVFINVAYLCIIMPTMFEAIYWEFGPLLYLSLGTLVVMLTRWNAELYFIKSVQATGEVLSFIEKVVPVLDAVTILLVFSNCIGLITLTMWR